MTPEEYDAFNARVQTALAGGMSLDEVTALTAELMVLFTAHKRVVSEQHRIALEAAKSDRLLKMIMSND